MTGAADGRSLPDASTKLRLVLDYLPCEACLAQPVVDQDLLCTICARVDRQVAVRVEARTTVLLERPSPPAAPVVIPPAPEPVAVMPMALVVRFSDEREAAPGAREVVVEPLPPARIPLVALRAAAAPQPPPALAPEEPEFNVDDLVTFIPAFQEYFDYAGPLAAHRAYRAPVPREPEPEPVVLAREAPPPEDDFVFRPPDRAPEPSPVEESPIEEVVPIEEVPVERAMTETREEEWAPASDFLPEEETEPVVERTPEPAAEPEEEVFEMEVLPEEEEIFEAELVEDDVVEMELLPDEEAAPAPPAPTSSFGDLWRLRGYDAASDGALGRSGITEVVHLSGHDAGELASRTGIAFDRLVPWIQVADLVQEVGVPLDAAIALVAAGIAGPKGLAEADPDEIADRASAFGGYAVNARDVRRWKRRA
ncbi:MAG TPA: hypothetical protein VM370_06905 [Candidatus Thermoplasmatota archaeon]|nr:hypothetical protein [Candidatus Thermoplasmatota archaeon]